ncbi:HAD family hydrolase [Profundibacterium mesophilum]|uniref:2-haloacid dehalogenase n=1 Tax=Profundibacterium mesophilum KAUST100406-0324 TaxID=1037889 RepID=A0A921NQ02_9RHOB|nr:HAD family phosphatase [Profundibacterium mesophilum]KAF0676521.1 2-haloacid dehalogenase [Profundibacterium mesophilum KAUST100406-0324]
MAVDAVIFDIGNVLIEWQPERYYDGTIGPERRAALFEAIDLHAMNDRIDAGGDFQQTVYDTADANPQWRAEIRDWHDRWIEMARPAIPHSIELLKALRSKGVPVFALSNFGIGSFAFAETQYPFLKEFDRRYISGHMGVIKPEAAIFEQVEADCGLRPDTLLFTDDREDNVAAARARGWQTHLFRGAEGFADRLVEEGLLSAREAVLPRGPAAADLAVPAA